MCLFLKLVTHGFRKVSNPARSQDMMCTQAWAPESPQDLPVPLRERLEACENAH
jgi:hypothetical protein